MKKSHILFVFAWVLGISTVAGFMHSWHLVDLSPTDKKLVELDLSKKIPNVSEFGVVHFLTPKCSCSQSIFAHLMERGPLSDSSEVVFIIEDTELDFIGKLKSKGFNVSHVTTEMIKKDFSGAIRGVPLLVIYDNKKQAQYVGGYSEKSITPFTKINISKYLSTLRKGRKIASNPVIGCAVSKEYQSILDPFGLKYRSE